jgi:hypothetical protein
MTANGNGAPQDPAAEAVRTREQLERTAEASAAKADDLKGRVQEKAAQAKDAVTEHAGQAVHVTRETIGHAKEKVGQAKDKVSDLTPEDATITGPPAVRGAGVGAATIGLAVTVAIWLLRRRARRNANPWQVAARNAQAQIKTVRKETKSSLKAARKRSQAEAASQVAAARAKARKVRSKAKSRT